MIKMRKIKYRTWNKEEKKMFYGIERTYDGYEEDSFASYLYSPNKYIVMQFTGLKDKNDKDIFEGDIVEIQQHPDIFYTGEVKYVNGCFSINGIMIGTVCNKNLRILGNIYEKED